MIARHKLSFVTDTGANGRIVSGAIYGSIVQVGYTPGDTGVRADTGAVLTLTMDTGNQNVPLAVWHLAPNGASWIRGVQCLIYDTGGAGVSQAAAPFMSGEKITASVQGIATDTGKDISVYVTSFDGGS